MIMMCSTCCMSYDVSEKTPLTTADVDIRGVKRSVKGRTRFYCCGSVPPAGIYRKRHGMVVKDGVKDVETAREADENENTYGITRLEDPEIPYVGELPEQLYQGRAIEVQGKVLDNAQRFSINLSTNISEDSDLGLHFNPRFDRRVVIRNHYIKGSWGVEERVSIHPFPFKKGKVFRVLIAVADETFMIAVNNSAFCSFSFRIPVERIKYLVLSGDITASLVHHHDTTIFPPVLPQRTPFVVIPRTLKNTRHQCVLKRKVKILMNGVKVILHGRLRLLPKSFYINLQQGKQLWPHPIIPFHMNLRVHQPGERQYEQEVIFNSWSTGGWGKEEYSSDVPFAPGTPFKLSLTINKTSYTVHVNDVFLHEFQQKDESPASHVDTVYIHGDVIVSKLTIR